MKKYLILSIALLMLCLTSCQKGNNSSTNHSSNGSSINTTGNGSSSGTSTTNSSTQSFDRKNQKGAGVIFEEEQGFNTKDASVIEEGNTRYVVYSSNETKNTSDSIIACRKATKVDGKWVYGEKKTILTPSATGWDKKIGNPSVIKGEFEYNSTKYSYLLAYDGTSSEENLNNQIGLAVSNDMLGTWTKVGETPTISYSAEVLGNQYGCGAPSMVSYDKKGKVRMMYSYGETNLSNERIIDCDFTNLNKIVMDAGTRQIQVKGLNDNGDQTILSNASFALSETGKTYMVRDVYPLSGNNPGCSTSIEIASADVKIFNDFSYSWTSITKITGMDTIDEENPESLGWDEIYSGTFVTDEYGYVNDSASLEIIYSTYNEPEESTDTTYKFSANLCSYTINLGA